MKRLRASISSPLRFFLCGEYGDQYYRPHYHVIVFGFDFADDRILWRKSPSGYLCYRSPLLERAWPFGFCEIGSLTPQSAGYVARYVTKKVGGDISGEHYRRVHPITGEVVQVAREFGLMSRRPGIGSGWLDRFRCDVYPSDFVTVDGRRRPVPRFYSGKLDDRERLDVRTRRVARAHELGDIGEARRRVVEECTERRANLLVRTLEE